MTWPLAAADRNALDLLRSLTPDERECQREHHEHRAAVISAELAIEDHAGRRVSLMLERDRVVAVLVVLSLMESGAL